MRKYVCAMCMWEYDPQEGCAVRGIQPGTRFEDVPDDFECPACGAHKVQFFPSDSLGGDAPRQSTG